MAYGLQIHTSNQLELLGDLLAEEVSRPSAGALHKEFVVVQGRSMALWLSMHLSRALGVFANAEFLYPRNFVERMFQLALPPGEDPASTGAIGLEGYRPDALAWAILDSLPGMLSNPAFAALKRYVGEDPLQLKRFELSTQIARSFDEYLTFRPELLRAWQGDETQGDLFQHAWGSIHLGWQERLWCSLVERLGPHHFAAQEPRFLRALARKRRPAELPERISVFALTNLPPLYVRVLAALSRHSEVHVFGLHPSSPNVNGAELTALELGDREPDASTSGKPAMAGFRNNPHPLTRSWGQLGLEVERTWSKELRVLGTIPTLTSRYGAAQAHSLLGRLHDALGGQTGVGTLLVPADDQSISVHSCHSPMREVEVLHDQVQALLESGFAPDEILVMMPNVDEYAPLIQAVFDRPQDPTAIPYRISDRKPQGDSPVLEAFTRILLLADRRLAASEVLDLLGLGPVHERFGMRESDLEVITRWIVDSGVRWGLDAEHKVGAGMPNDTTHSWRFGLDRLLLGYATLGDDTSLIGGLLPYPEVEGSQGLLLGRLSSFVDTLSSVVTELAEPRSAAAWQTTLTDVLTRLVTDTSVTAWQHIRVRQALAALAESASHGRCTALLSLQVVRQWLDETFSREREAHGFLAGGINFCTLVPMRSIPFRAVALLGMNERAFPRSTRRPDFNVMGRARERRRDGDPDRRLDDRQLFLEAVLSAREKLILSYVGQSIRDNSQSSPSIVISELLDELERLATPRDADATIGGGHGPLRDRIVIRHPLQPFSPRYYDGRDPRLFSFEAGYLSGAAKVDRERSTPKPLLSRALDAAELTECALPLLLEFFRSPAEYLLRYKLELQRPEEYLEVPDREPVELNPLDAYAIGARSLALLSKGLPPRDVERVVRAGAVLPGGAPGHVHFEALCNSLLPMLEGLQRLTHGGAVPAAPVALTVDGVRLVGSLDQLYSSGRIEGRFARSSARHDLRAWLLHLVLCATRPPGVAPFSVQICRVSDNEGAAISCFKPVAEPLPLLADLLKLYRVGQSEPLMLFPKASLGFVELLRKNKPEVEAVRQFGVQKDWAEERDQSHALQRIYGQGAELDVDGPRGTHPPLGGPSFAQVARRVFEPLLDHVERLALAELAMSAQAAAAHTESKGGHAGV
jgi:exodeoxyribonuclease V gamma subunit